jgi:nucleotide-binding universal stress UspA family protein
MYRKILVLVDDRKVTQSAIGQAIALAQVHHAAIFFFGVLPQREYPTLPKATEEASHLLSAASTWAERCGVHHQRDLGLCSDDAHAVADAAVKQKCDLIVVGSDEQNAGIHPSNGIIVPDLISAATVPMLVCREHPIFPQHCTHLPRPFVDNSLIRREIGTRKHDETND